jgi:hypothetical protein
MRANSKGLKKIQRLKDSKIQRFKDSKIERFRLFEKYLKIG